MQLISLLLIAGLLCWVLSRSLAFQIDASLASALNVPPIPDNKPAPVVLVVPIERQELPPDLHWQEPGQVRQKATTRAHYLYDAQRHTNGAAL